MSSFRRFNSSSGSSTSAQPTYSVPLPGTRASAQNGCILTSTGVPSFDDVIGGGIPLSNMYLIREDRFTGYSTLLLKYFLCQGIASGHAISLTSLDVNPEQLLRDLMGVVESSSSNTSSNQMNTADDDAEFIPSASGLIMQPGASSTTRQMGVLRGNVGSGTSTDTMKIAWRYQSMSKFSSAPSSTSASLMTASGKAYCNTFDLTKRISDSLLESTMVSLHDIDSLGKDGDNYTTDLLAKIQAQLEQGGFRPSNQSSSSSKNVLRIAIHSFLSPMWNVKSRASFQQAFNMLMSLREMLRNSSAVCLVTLPAHLYDDFYGHKDMVHPMIQRMHHPFDAVFEIESFSGSPHPVNPRYTSDYHGLFHVWKLFSYNSLTDLTSLSNIQRQSLAFKVRRKRFSIEFFHLPPEDGDEEGVTSGEFHSQASKTHGVSNVGNVKSGVSAIAKKRSAVSGSGCSHSGGKVPPSSNPLDF